MSRQPLQSKRVVVQDAGFEDEVHLLSKFRTGELEQFPETSSGEKLVCQASTPGDSSGAQSLAISCGKSQPFAEL